MRRVGECAGHDLDHGRRRCAPLPTLSGGVIDRVGKTASPERFAQVECSCQRCDLAHPTRSVSTSPASYSFSGTNSLGTGGSFSSPFRRLPRRMRVMRIIKRMMPVL